MITSLETLKQKNATPYRRRHQRPHRKLARDMVAKRAILAKTDHAGDIAGDVDPKSYTIAARLTSPETLYQNFYTVIAKHLKGCSKIYLYRMQIDNYGAKIAKTVVAKTICI
jgi:hypothetical protein